MIFYFEEEGCATEIEADNEKKAITKYFSDVSIEDYIPDANKTIHVEFLVSSKQLNYGDYCPSNYHRLDPIADSCTGDGHKWTSPYEIVGGLKENPGVTGNGGGLIIREICKYCQLEKVTNTWDTNPETGQKVETIKYLRGDDG